jgi:hypothetical protein
MIATVPETCPAWAKERLPHLETIVQEPVRSGMRPIRPTVQLWQVMLAIATLAGLFAVFGVTGTLAILIAVSVVFLPIVMASAGRKLRAAAWVCFVYPVLPVGSLYATWFIAWCVLGHQPGLYLDDPKYISPIVEVPHITTYLLMLGLPLALLQCIPLTLAYVAQSVWQRRIGPWNGVAHLFIPLVLWLSIFAISRWDFLQIDHVSAWFMD